MTALVIKEDNEGVLLRPFLIPRISTLSSYYSSATGDIGGVRCQNAGRGKLRHVSMRQLLRPHVSIDLFTTHCEVTNRKRYAAGGRFRSQGDNWNASWFNIIEMVDPLSADYRIVKAAWIWKRCRQLLENSLLQGYLTRCQ